MKIPNYLAAVTTVLISALAFSSTARAETSFKMAYIAPQPVWGPIADRYAEEVAKRTDGEIIIKGVGGGQLGSLPQNWAGLKTGQISMMLVETNTFAIARGGEDLSAISAPYLFNDHEHFRRFIMSDTFAEMMAPVEEAAGFKYVGYVSDRAPRQLTTNDTKVMTPDDLQGFKVRVPEIPVILNTFKAWGATPTPVAGSELYLALKQGLVEGQDNGFDAIAGAKLYEVQKYVIRTEYIRSGLTVVMANLSWNRLSDEQKQALQEATAATDEWASARNTEISAQAENIAIKNGMEIIEPDLAPFKKLANEAAQEMDGVLWSKGVLDKISSVK